MTCVGRIKHGDAKSVAGTGNTLLGGHDVVMLGTTGFGESRVVSNSIVNLGQGNDTLTVYSKLQNTDIYGGSGNDTFGLSIGEGATHSVQIKNFEANGVDTLLINDVDVTSQLIGEITFTYDSVTINFV